MSRLLIATVAVALSGAATLVASPGNDPTQTGLPNASMTPGAVNRAVTQANIGDTICVRGWTRTVRPPESYTERLKRRQVRQYGYADRRLHLYEEDHLIPLELGGAPRDPRNLWPEPRHVADYMDASVKDRLENRLHRLVCERRIRLRVAQRMFATNWVEAYRSIYGQ